MEIKSKVALVTGGGSGIGRATALRLAREGAAVAIADIDEAGVQRTAGEIEEAGGRAAFVRADVTQAADAERMVSFAEETFGGLDILHNNAGILTGRPGYPDAEPERWVRVLEINLRGVILGTQYGIRSMRERGGGVIVNTASIAGIGYGFPADPVYAASKGGVVLFTASLAPLKESANIRVNCVCPGIVDTPMTQRAREAAAAGGPAEDNQISALFDRLPVIEADEVADAVAELIRDDSLAGRAMLLRNGLPRELAPLPEAAAVAGAARRPGPPNQRA